MEREDQRARNRRAASKWRQKNDEYLSKLEEDNNSYRRKAFDMLAQLRGMTLENSVLEEQLSFFQKFVSGVVNGGKTDGPGPE
jgi:hypothetical protein